MLTRAAENARRQRRRSHLQFAIMVEAHVLVRGFPEVLASLSGGQANSIPRVAAVVVADIEQHCSTLVLSRRVGGSPDEVQFLFDVGDIVPIVHADFDVVEDQQNAVWTQSGEVTRVIFADNWMQFHTVHIQATGTVQEIIDDLVSFDTSKKTKQKLVPEKYLI